MRVLDSSFCADFLRGREHAKEYRLNHREESFVLPAVGFHELYHGAVKVGRESEEVDEALPWVKQLDYTRTHPDMMLAGVARSLDAPIVTSDRRFDRIDDLDTENPREMY